MIFEDDLYEGDPETWSGALWRTTLALGGGLSGDRAVEVGEALEEIAVSVSTHNHEAADGDRWTVSLLTLGEPDRAALAALLRGAGIDPAQAGIETVPVERRDWLRHVHDNFPPVEAGIFFVHGSHHTGACPPELTPLVIDAATAFGSGEHETTKGCLLALQELKAQGFTPGAALDMGCGSGILAIAMTKLWPGLKAAAVDIDPESVTVTARHADMNGAAGDVEAGAGEGYAAPLAQSRAPYDLIAANILAGPLIAMAGDLAMALRPGGRAILSGLLARQGDEVLAAHTAQGLTLTDRRDIGGWLTLTLEKPV